MCYASTKYYNAHINSTQHSSRQLWDRLKELFFAKQILQYTNLFERNDRDIIKNPLIIANLYNVNMFAMCVCRVNQILMQRLVVLGCKGKQ